MINDPCKMTPEKLKTIVSLIKNGYSTRDAFGLFGFVKGGDKITAATYGIFTPIGSGVSRISAQDTEKIYLDNLRGLSIGQIAEEIEESTESVVKVLDSFKKYNFNNIRFNKDIVNDVLSLFNKEFEKNENVDLSKLAADLHLRLSDVISILGYNSNTIIPEKVITEKQIRDDNRYNIALGLIDTSFDIRFNGSTWTYEDNDTISLIDELLIRWKFISLANKVEYNNIEKFLGWMFTYKREFRPKFSRAAMILAELIIREKDEQDEKQAVDN